MTKRIKNLSVLAVAVLAGLFVTFSTLDIHANQFLIVSNDVAVSVTTDAAITLFAIADLNEDSKCGEGKCGEGKCGGAAKETKKETKKEGTAKTEKETKKVTTEESKCGEGKCGGAEKKEAKTEKKESKEAKGAEGKCGEGKCGVA